MQKINKLFLGLFLLLSFVSGSIAQTTLNGAIKALKLLNTYEIPYNLNFKETTVGGFSGIDYDTTNHLYYFISDDRSAINPARFYTAKMVMADSGIQSFSLENVYFFYQKDGAVYPSNIKQPRNAPDPENLRLHPATGTLWWTSEGERIVTAKDTILNNPSVTITDLQGNFKYTLTLPENLSMSAYDKGPRKNGVLEGCTFMNDFQHFLVNVEEPLINDGSAAQLKPAPAFIRIYKYDVKTGENTAQYAYLLDPIANKPTPETAFMINGVPDILAIGNNQLLIMERSFSIGNLACTIKIFCSNLNSGSDIKQIETLKAATFKPLEKKLLLNLDTLGIYIDNIEGMVIGPKLSNGHRTLIMVADNNFSPLEKAQLLAFEVIEE